MIRRASQAAAAGLLSLALGSVLAPPRDAAGQPERAYRIGVLAAGSPRSQDFYQAFYGRLRELGYEEGRNLSIDHRSAEDRAERAPEIAAELLRAGAGPPDLIVAVGPEWALRAAVRATGDSGHDALPIVVVAIDYDPVARGYIAGLARPGGRITGVVFRQVELAAKRLQLLTEAVPGAARVAVLWDGASADQLQATQSAAGPLALQLQPIELGDAPPYDFDRALDAAAREGAAAVLSSVSPAIFRGRERLASAAQRHRLPAMYAARQFAEAGGLMAYGANFAEQMRRAAAYVDKILKGARPAELPVEEASTYELVINLKTARALGLELPQSLLLRADEVIE
jgi:putative ABC transport system substrate-binding protein